MSVINPSPDATTDSAYKPTAYLIAQLTVAGHAVHQGHAGDFTVCKYGMTRYCKDLAELQAFAKQLGVTA
jgi:hypothetical protein